MNGKVLSYSAGSTSLDPYKFRVINDQQPSGKMQRLAMVFPELASFFGDPSQSLVIDAYPAALGGMESMTRVITYLHPPTCVRALRLAAAEKRRVVFIGQPLAGADLLLHAMETEMQWPTEVLWATGGYPMPTSLQQCVKDWLADRGCELSVLKAYGVAELDHTLLASMEEDIELQPIYQLIDERLQLDQSTNATTMRFNGQVVANPDRIEKTETGYRIQGDPSRYNHGVLRWLEQWQPSDWKRCTGYFAERDGEVILQRRLVRSVAVPGVVNRMSFEAMASLPRGTKCQPVCHFEFMADHGMSWLEKPKWNLQLFTQLAEERNRSAVSAAA
ncbi:hypothetical protein LOC71_17150 [Rhodopirellula sp. JC740]|uniref:AMP-dependent synthetase/ligase domain-containing protein n=1 Tax=Rhodopirellula halodulae TaxID=2894198 RepID=A0ABS8NKB9_9BACT|nr:hypothetical protein [Rhodopirellula sp. JC740]MCC9644013.1 hypothetical protein [Rhodopirellula sp. JC740]